MTRGDTMTFQFRLSLPLAAGRAPNAEIMESHLIMTHKWGVIRSFLISFGNFDIFDSMAGKNHVFFDSLVKVSNNFIKMNLIHQCTDFCCWITWVSKCPFFHFHHELGNEFIVNWFFYKRPYWGSLNASMDGPRIRGSISSPCSPFPFSTKTYFALVSICWPDTALYSFI